MRRFIIATNKPDLIIPGTNVIEMKIEDLAVMFNQDCLNVLNEKEYNQLLQAKYMFGLEVEFADYLTGYGELLANLLKFDQDLIVVYDVSIKRYINHHELNYFAANQLLPSKLFNVEIESDENGTTYTTLGLASIGLKEFEFNTDLYLNEEDFQIFKAVVTNHVIGKQAKVNINVQNVQYSLVEHADKFVFDYERPSRIYEFYVRDDMSLDKIRYQLIKFHWDKLQELKRKRPDLGNYLINKGMVYDFENFEVVHVEEFTIVCEGINYNQDNLFYAYKYL